MSARAGIEKNRRGRRDERSLAEAAHVISDAGADEDFLAAERSVADLLAQRKDLYRQYPNMGIEEENELIINGVDVHLDRVENFINETPPKTLVGAASHKSWSGSASMRSLTAILAVAARRRDRCSP
jgi:hypothetical protein